MYIHVVVFRVLTMCSDVLGYQRSGGLFPEVGGSKALPKRWYSTT